MGGRSTGFAIPVVLGLWVAGVIFALGNVRDGAERRTAPAPGASPVPLPTEVVVGTSLDPSTGMVAEPVSNVRASQTIAFSVWLGTPYGASEVVVALARLESDGFEIVGEIQQLPVSPDSPVLAGLIPGAALMERLGPGTYLVDVQRPSGDRIGYGVVQVETDTPESVEIFVDGWRRATVLAGDHTGYQFGSDGEIVAEITESVDEDVWLWSNHRATFGGREYLFIVEGPWADHYLAEPHTVRLVEEAGRDGRSPIRRTSARRASHGTTWQPLDRPRLV